ncbi:MAG: type I methionyl aminopeptidase, partial [Candidatus Kapaibacterium sp.]
TDGLVICIEPMVNAGTYRVSTLDDKWTVVTQDGKPSAHFEHTLVVREGAAEILTKLPDAILHQ